MYSKDLEIFQAEEKHLTTGKKQAAGNLIMWTIHYVRLHVTEMHPNKSVVDQVHQPLPGSEIGHVENIILI